MIPEKNGMNKPLTAAFVRRVTRPGRYGDGGRGSFGLYLRVWHRPNGRVGKAWAQRIRIHERPTNLGLGPAAFVTLAEARETARKNARLVYQGQDPRGDGVPTFEKATKRVLRLRRSNWKPGSRTEAQWRAAFARHVFPRLGAKRVDRITGRDVLAVLTADDLWNGQRATARRVLQWMTAVFEWATAAGHRPDNPATAIRAALPKTGGRVKHQRAIHHSKVAAALEAIQGASGRLSPKLCLRCIVLTACRSGEAREARWEDVDGDVWTIPETGTKAGREHRVPLPGAALAILDEAAKLSDGSGLIFPGARGGRPVGAASLTRLLARVGVDAVPHGFRSSFRDWCGETGVPREVAEACLAHVVGGTEGAYARSDLLERRRDVMERWSGYLTGGCT